MYFEIPEIKKISQNAADVLKLAFNRDVFILNRSLDTVLSTSSKHNSTIYSICKAIVPNDILSSDSICYIDNIKGSKPCSDCKNNAQCPIKSGMFMPVTVNLSTIGIIGYQTYDDNQKKELHLNYEKYKQLFEKTAFLMQNNIANFAKSHNLNTIIDSMYYCMISTDENGYIKYLNKSALKLLEINREDATAKNIKDLLECSEIDNAIKSNINSDKVKSKLTLYKNKKTFNISISSHAVKNHMNESLFVFSFDSLNDESNTCTDDSIIKSAFAKVKGNSIELKKVITFAAKVASSSSTILLTGESGTGKELFAKSIHDSSPRKSNMFVAVNCSSIPDNLLESELFGYDEGAFTGSKKSGKKGKFELANNGTIFLDEIGDMDFNLQAKLLRVLEEHEIERLGSNETVKLDIRVISATNKKLDEMVKNGQFREDLYYRLNVIPIQLPPLRSRKSDIKILINHFLDKYNKELSKNILGIDTYALEILMDYEWPGNIRELSNVIEYTMHMEIDDYIHYNSLPSKIINYSSNAAATSKIKPDEMNEITAALEIYGNTTDGKKKAAKHLNMSLSTLYRKLAQLNM